MVNEYALNPKTNRYIKTASKTYQRLLKAGVIKPVEDLEELSDLESVDDIDSIDILDNIDSLDDSDELETSLNEEVVESVELEQSLIDLSTMDIAQFIDTLMDGHPKVKKKKVVAQLKKELKSNSSLSENALYDILANA